MGYLEGPFDFDGDGKLDGFEKATRYHYISGDTDSDDNEYESDEDADSYDE